MDKLEIIEKWKSQKTKDFFYKKDKKKIKLKKYDRFFGKKLNFGVEGFVGKMGLGTSKINEFTIAAIAKAYAKFILNNIPEAQKKGIIISHDSRINGEFYSEIISRVFEKYGISVYSFKVNKPQTSPITSFAITKLKLAGGIVVTAAQLSKKYNGIKLLDQKGAQVSSMSRTKIQDIYYSIDPLKVELGIYKPKRIKTILIKEYIEEVLKIRKRPLDQKLLKVTFVSLSGNQSIIGPKILQKMDLSYHTLRKKNKTLKKYYKKDFSFNSKMILNKSILMARKKQSDIIIIMDSDSSSIRVIYKNSKNFWKELNGNQIAAIVFNYLIKTNKKLNGKVIQSILSSSLLKEMAKVQKMDFIETKPGFHNISETGLKNNLITSLSWEQSHGLSVDAKICRDRDGFQAMIFILEFANYLKTQNSTFEDELKYLEDKYKYSKTGISIKKLSGEELEELFDKIVKTQFINNDSVLKIHNYTKTNNPTESKILKIVLKSGSWFAIEKSLINENQKIYYESLGINKRLVNDTFRKMKSHINDIVSIIKK
ncbi:MAG: hypothetical protein GY679_03740 [Mycoplasma sp.]|nr:hypothetical protein [Mycoplasma sp.]